MSPLSKLLSISQKEKKLILGLMSGTSCDGLDIALCEIEGHGYKSKVKVREFVSVPYTSALKHILLELSAARVVPLRDVSFWNSKLADLHSDYILAVLEKWGVHTREIDMIGSHGHTLYHAPDHDSERPFHTTLQIADGDFIATKTGIVTISDFRQQETARGREGAPVSGYADALLFGKPDINQFFLNIGGIANVSWLPPGKDNLPVSGDTGPGNTLIDDAIRHYYEEKEFDKNGDIAKSGSVNNEYLKALKAHDFFRIDFPKSTGRELFSRFYWKSRLPDGLEKEDVIATLSQFTVDTICDVISSVYTSDNKNEIVVSGGGAFNRFLVDGISEKLPHAEVSVISEYGISADSKEALIFAVFANEAVSGEGVIPFMGKVSLPG